MKPPLENKITEMFNREATEWLNYWWDNGNVYGNERILLIGDSTSRQYRGNLAKILQCSVDFFASSTSICDDLFWKELNLFFSINEYRHHKAQIQIGYHGIDSVGGAKQKHNLEQYELAYEKLVQTVQKYVPDIIIATYTHVVFPNNLEMIDQKINNEIIKRNNIAIKVASKYKLKVNDLHTYMLNEGMQYKHIDRVHFEPESNDFIADRVAKYLL